MNSIKQKKKKKNARVLRNSGPELYIYIYMNINLCINKSLYILYIYIYFTTEEKFIFKISTFVVDAIVAHIPRQRILDFKEIKKK